MRPAIEYIKNKYKDNLIIGAEIGVAEGNHALELVKILNFKELILVDVWENIESNIPYNGNFVYYYQLVTNHFKSMPYVKIKKGYSAEIAKQIPDNYLDFIYIDAGHTYIDVKNDLEAWLPKIKKGGIIAGHDYMNTSPSYEGLNKAVEEFIHNNKFKIQMTKDSNKNYLNSDWWCENE